MKQIPLSQGKFALVDDEDFEELSKFKWCASKTKKYIYATRKQPLPTGGRKMIYMHRQIMGISDKTIFCDHISGDTLDNRRQNLRICSAVENGFNRTIGQNNTSGFKGVYEYKKGKFFSMIRANKKSFYLGSFDSPEKAAAAYDKAAKELHGEFAKPNQ